MSITSLDGSGFEPVPQVGELVPPMPLPSELTPGVYVKGVVIVAGVNGEPNTFNDCLLRLPSPGGPLGWASLTNTFYVA